MKPLLFLFVSLLLFSCSKNPAPKPDNLLDEDVMVNIIFDIAILQAADGNMPYKLAEANINANQYVFKKYKIDSITYSQNQRYYASDSRKYKKIYKKVIERLDLEQKKMNDTTKATNASDDVKKSFSVSE